MSEPLIEFREVYKTFGDTKVLRGVNLKIHPGEITVIIGKSGEGKSVLLKHIIGLIKPDSGRVLIEGKDIWAIPRKERKDLLKTFSYLFQGTALFDSITVYENISMPLTEKTRLNQTQVIEKVHRVMDLLDLHDVDKKYPSQLSGGMQKRVALARALVTSPHTLLFDEPTTGLDPIRKTQVLNMVADYHEKLGFTGVLVSHAIPDILYIAQRVAFLQEGKIIFQGSPTELLDLQNDEVQQFFEGVKNQCEHPIWPLEGEAAGTAGHAMQNQGLAQESSGTNEVAEQ